MDFIERNFKISYDASADAAYIYLSDTGTGAVAETVPMDPLAVKGMINLDFDAETRLVGIEVLGARSRLPRALLQPEF